MTGSLVLVLTNDWFFTVSHPLYRLLHHGHGQDTALTLSVHLKGYTNTESKDIPFTLHHFPEISRTFECNFFNFANFSLLMPV